MEVEKIKHLFQNLKDFKKQIKIGDKKFPKK